MRFVPCLVVTSAVVVKNVLVDLVVDVLLEVMSELVDTSSGELVRTLIDGCTVVIPGVEAFLPAANY